MDGGKLSEVNARTVSRRQNELVGKFKMVAGDLVSIRGQVKENFLVNSVHLIHTKASDRNRQCKNINMNTIK